MDDKEKEKYLLRLPTFEDVRLLLDDNDLIGSNDCGNTWSLEKLNGWNKLSHKGKSVYKLFRKLRQEIKKSQPSIWSSYNVPVSQEFRKSLLRPLSPNIMSKIKKSQQYEEYSSDENKSNSKNSNKNNESNNLMNKVFNSHKPEKRKYEESSEDRVNRENKTANTSAVAYVGYKRPNHLLSSDESEMSDSNPYYNKTVQKNAASVTNMLESDNTCVNRNDSDSFNGRPSKSTLHHGNLNNRNKESITSTEKMCREHIFTQRDEEEISKFSSLLDEDIARDNHVWILQCPSSMDCSGLIGQKLDLNGNCKLGVGQRSYEAFSFRSQDSKEVSLAVPSHRNQLKLMRIPLTGNIIVEEVPDINSDSSYSITEAPQRVALPKDLPIRHPLFGKHFKKQLKMAKKMEEKRGYSYVCSSDLGETKDETFKSPTEKKKKRKRESAEFNHLTISESSSFFGSSKKKKIKQEY